jgi:hypothetical protein
LSREREKNSREEERKTVEKKRERGAVKGSSLAAIAVVTSAAMRAGIKLE